MKLQVNVNTQHPLDSQPSNIFLKLATFHILLYLSPTVNTSRR